MYWQLTALEASCDVVAPTLVPVKSGERVKIDRRDALKLERNHRAGELTAVWVPDAAHEALPNLLRVREATKKDQLRAKDRPRKFLLRHGRRPPMGIKLWTLNYLTWVKQEVHFEQLAQEATLLDYLYEVDHLRSKRRMRRSRHASEHGHSRGQIVDAISIRERPAEAEDRAIPGHWENDLLAGGKNSYIATLVERHSRFLMLIKMPSKDTAVVVAALSKRVRKLPATLRRSWDRGLEMAKHKAFTVATDVQVYFCDPQSPWQRGTNENTNLLLRQYFPRGTDLAPITQAQMIWRDGLGG